MGALAPKALPSVARPPPERGIALFLRPGVPASFPGMGDVMPSDLADSRRLPGTRRLLRAGEVADRYYLEHRDAIDLCLEFRRTARVVLAACDRFLAAFRLSDVAMTVLLELRRAPSGEPAALADRAGVRPTTLALVLGRLEREGWLERVPHPRDARRRPVRLTPLGRARLDLLLRDYYQLTTAQLGPLSAGDRAALRRLLELIRTASPPPPRRSWAELGYDLEEPWEEWDRRAERRAKRRRRR